MQEVYGNNPDGTKKLMYITVNWQDIIDIHWIDYLLFNRFRQTRVAND